MSDALSLVYLLTNMKIYDNSNNYSANTTNLNNAKSNDNNEKLKPAKSDVTFCTDTKDVFKTPPAPASSSSSSPMCDIVTTARNDSGNNNDEASKADGNSNKVQVEFVVEVLRRVRLIIYKQTPLLA